MLLSMTHERFSNSNGSLYFEDKNDLLKQYFERVLKKEYQGISEKQLIERMSEIEDPLEQMKFYMENGSGYRTISEEIDLMFHFQKFSIYAHITQKFVNSLTKFIGDKNVLEICSGAGFLAKGLAEQGVNIIATDIEPRINSFYDKVEQSDAVEAISKYGKSIEFVILTWSPLYSDIDWRALEKIREINRTFNKQIKMIVVGELGGCTNSEVFCENVIYLNSAEFSDVQGSYESLSNIRDRAYLIQ